MRINGEDQNWLINGWNWIEGVNKDQGWIQWLIIHEEWIKDQIKGSRSMREPTNSLFFWKYIGGMLEIFLFGGRYLNFKIEYSKGIFIVQVGKFGGFERN